MNKRIKRLWIKALRSGEYKQGHGQLCWGSGDEKFYCCLGVLEEIAVKEQIITDYKGWRGGLDFEVSEWAGLNGEDNPVLGPRVNSPLASQLNDSGKDFNYIADRIEKYL